MRVGRNAGGGPLRIAGKDVAYGIGTHSSSTIVFDVPPGVERFRARGGIDNGGSDQDCGSTVRFLVYTREPPQIVLDPPRPGSDSGKRDPADAVAGLDVHEDLEATLFASEPLLLSPTNLDVDHRGRVWVCEVVNYRGHNGKRPEGDRIVILEDTDGDGAADSSKVFYQGRDIDSAMGICVLGSKVIVSAAPWVFVLHDEDGDDRADRKEVLFSRTGSPQNDHSNHSFVFGPDGKLYWNFGNAGKYVHDRDGKIVVDKAGNEVRDGGRPYWGGMVFRCDLDGSGFEVLAHNFRNNYEVAVDSFGTVWQSDNDDDGNRGVRINYIMEFGNYGYRDELTGRGWRDARTNMEKEVPLRHWHLNDPGVVPNLLQTGGGSPTGITVYEGGLLPEVFQGEVVHCDAGPNVVRAYPVERDGAGYSASVVDILRGVRDRWFRPADVCVAPDGSLFITDWYDPGVGGHGMRDLGRGRVFRVAPRGHRYRVPDFDFDRVLGAVEALRNPNLAVRYLAWTTLHAKGRAAEPELARLWQSSDPRLRARALWLLGKIPGRGERWIERAIADSDPDLRITGLRLARQIDVDVVSIVEKLLDDPDPQVRRECLIALAEESGGRAGDAWVRLATQHDGRDRWYLEALGIAARGKWDDWLLRWMQAAGREGFHSASGRDIIWRSRAAASPLILATILAGHAPEADELPRYLRAFDFWSGGHVRDALLNLATGKVKSRGEQREFIAYEAIQRLRAEDVRGNEQVERALENVLGSVRGTARFVELVGRFRLSDRYGEIVDLAANDADAQLGVQAVRMLLSNGGAEVLTATLTDGDAEKAGALARSLGLSGDGRAVQLLTNIVRADNAALEVRRQAARSLAKSHNGAKALVGIARKDELDDDLRSAAAAGLATVRWNDVRQAAAELFPLPPAKNDQPVPPISVLVRRRGDAARGKQIFSTIGTCTTCHRVGDEGKEIGPSLTEIGSKLDREAFWESVLFPSAGIAHGYETHVLVLQTGETVTGIAQSETSETIAIKDANAIVHTVAIDKLLVRKKEPTSLMPADLHKALTVDQLADIVEYLTTLQKGR